MDSRPRVERVVIVVLDGLRPDAIEKFHLESWMRIAARGASTLRGSTVGPSVTAAAMGSLLSGVPPRIHGLTSDRFQVPRPTGPVFPLPRCLRGAGIPTTMYIRSIPFVVRGIAGRLAKMLGVSNPQFVGRTAFDIAGAARKHLEAPRRELVLLHLPDADLAGHEHGWMSDAYGDAARRMDNALGRIAAYARVDEDPGTLLIALADHGGGGVQAKDHDSDHPLDRTIPLLLSGAYVKPSCLWNASLLDVAPTVLSAFGVPIPAGYVGQPLIDMPREERIAA